MSHCSPRAQWSRHLRHHSQCTDPRTWWVLQVWMVKYFAVVFGGKFGWGDAQTAFLTVVNLTVKESCLYSCHRPETHWSTEHHTGKVLSLYWVTGKIYGWLATFMDFQTHLWTEEVVGRLTGLNYVRHDFDKMLFLNQVWWQPEIMSLIICYVDDFFGIHRQD